MRRFKLIIRKSTAVLLVLIIACGMIPSDLISDIDFSGIFSPLIALAEDVTDKFSSGGSAGSEYKADDCSFTDELYKGEDAIAPLPSYKEYKDSTGYTEPLRISLTDFMELCGTGLNFNVGTAQSYMSQGYKLMLCDAEELYNYSMIVNGASSPDEMVFYLSANIVLGDNIEFSKMSYEGYYFLPIGNESNPFTGTFDGQCFEIRDLYFDEAYGYITVAFFGVIGEGAQVENFGIFHPTISATRNNSTYTAAIASKNYGIVDSVYAIVQEYRNPNDIASTNFIKSANAYSSAGLIAENCGTISNSYFAGMLEASGPVNQNPVCAINRGTVTNCYYDREVFASGLTGTQITELEGEVEITPLSNLDLKRMDGMEDTKFKVNHAVADNVYSPTSTNKTLWCYPRLYGFTGTGIQDDPYIISTPADLIYFPSSPEYSFTYKYAQKHFQLEKCIDMNEVAPNAYKPKLDYTVYTNYYAGGKWTLNINKFSNKYFSGVLSGAAYNGDEACSICHVTGLGEDANGNELQECHAILNLTIDTPATTSSNRNFFTGLIAGASSFSSTIYFPAVNDLHFIGGEISTGDTDSLPSTYNSSAYNVKTATVVGCAAYVDMINVHSSATVKIGTGKQYSVQIGGLMGGGKFHNVTDCTNSGDIIGGYYEMPADIYQSENYQLGGLLGGAASENSLSASKIGKLTHVANYGNIYGVVVIANKDSGNILTGGASYISGVTCNSIASEQTGYTTDNPSGQESYYYNDSIRVDRVANFGMLFDGPVVLDDNGDPVFDENGKPQALPLDADKEIVGNNSLLYYTHIRGIASNMISHSYNEGNIYSVIIEKCRINGIGTMGKAKADSIGQLYNFLNYNVGNIYMYVGTASANGISESYAYKCYNHGNIYLYDGAIYTRTIYTTRNSEGGCFSGISGTDSAGCYFDGEIYIAPSERTIYNSETSENKIISIAGVSQYLASYLTETDENGKKVIIPTINNGKLTLDLDTNNFDPVANTTNLASAGYYPKFYMTGTGVGSYCYNYGEFDFIANTRDNSNKVALLIAGLGGLFNRGANIENSINYSEINIDNSNAEGSLRYLMIYGLGRCFNDNNSSYRIANSANLGDISFKGYIGGDLDIRSFAGVIPDYSAAAYATTSNNMDLGNITVDKSSVITGNTYIWGCYFENANPRYIRTESFMQGWYDGCTVPSGIKSTFGNILANLDKSRRYGVINVSGTFKSGLYITPVSAQNNSCIESAKSMIGNGFITLTNANITGNCYIRALSYISVTFSENHTPINVDNVVMYKSTYVYGGVGGEYNVNYAPISVKHCLTLGDGGTFFTGVYQDMSVVSNCENRGDITVTDCTTATVLGLEYKAPILEGITNKYDSTFVVSGIGSGGASRCINFGNISVSNVNRCRVSGVVSSSAIDCYNYGDITVSDSGGFAYVGGITGYIEKEQSVRNCYNFGRIDIKNPNSYPVKNQPNIYVGGICGYASGTKGVDTSVNYGEITYNNEKGENTDSTNYENTRYSSSFSLSIGGVVGLSAANSSISKCMNYADLAVVQEKNMITKVGGIIGSEFINSTNNSVCSNVINYGNISVPDANTGSKQTIDCGGIIGFVDNDNYICTKVWKYGINYGTVKSETEKSTNTSVGSLIGRDSAQNSYTFYRFTDLSDLPEGRTYYPLIGNHTYPKTSANFDDAVNYTKNEASIDDTTAAVNGKFGTVELVTLDKNEDTGFYSSNFIYRSALAQEITENITNQDNGLVYQDFNLLSPYLQEYMLSEFGDEIKEFGAYVLVKDNRSGDVFIPGNKITDLQIEKGEYLSIIPGSFNTAFDSSVLEDRETNEIYAKVLKKLGISERTVYSDYNVYAQQVEKSSLPEIYDFGVYTKYPYANTDTSYFQFFDEYQTFIETHPAKLEDGTLSDTIIYTDINVYIAVDDIDPYKAIKGDDVFDTGGIIYLNEDLNYNSAKSSVQIYQGSRVDITSRSDDGFYKDQYPVEWLNADTLNSEMENNPGEWSESYGYGKDKSLSDANDLWNMEIKYRKNTSDAEGDMGDIYTKVVGVITAEDGIHKNIVVAHVVIDTFRPSATLSNVMLSTPQDNESKVSYLTSTVDNGLLNEKIGQPSITDFVDGVPVNDVTYYYLDEEYADGKKLNGENIQKYNWEEKPSYPVITVTTYNMDESGQVYYDLYYQDRLPSEEGLTYNELRWNGASDSKKISSGEVNPTDIEYNSERKSTGTATIELNYNNQMLYGGYYKVVLYYERTKNSGAKRHFATVFIAKEHSSYNMTSYNGAKVLTPNNNVLTNQAVYDSAHDVDENGYQTGYIAVLRGMYSSAKLSSYYYDRETNESNYNQGKGLYYSLKAYMSKLSSATYYIDKDNPFYYSSEAEESDLKKGKEVKLEQNIRSINVCQDDETGAYYPILFQGVMDVMAENGDIRRYTFEQVQSGDYGETDEYAYDNNPKIYQVLGRKNGYPIVASSDGTYKGVIYGEETDDATFICQWTSKNVSLAYAQSDENDGFRGNRINIYYTPINSDKSVELTQQEINQYFSVVKCDANNSNNWTFKMLNSAPVGTYTLIPYMTYTMDLSENEYPIELYDNETGKLIELSDNNIDNNIFKWTIPYTQPFVIENRPNDDSYLTEYDTSNDQCTPFVLEDSYVDGKENRSVYIRSATANQEISYVGYENVKTGDIRVDKFNVYSYVAKTQQTSEIRIKAPYMATVSVWTGTGDATPHNSVQDYWSEVTDYTEENGIWECKFNVQYNEYAEGTNDHYTYNPSVTYYKVTAEDRKTSTIYTVYVVPGVRNKFTTLEIGQTGEIPKISGSEAHKEEVAALFEESEKLYNEIMENNGYVNVTIKELNGDTVDLFQTKFFDGANHTGETQPYVYNLKSYAYDISVDLPAGYTYDVLLFSDAKDGHTELSNSQNGFDGKQLILSNSDDQWLHIRIVIKRETTNDVWGVQYIWNFSNANTDDSGRILNNEGGYFYNYVYRRDD